MTPRNWWNLANQENDEKGRWDLITGFLKDVYTILLKNVSFADNIKGSIISVTFSTSNEDVAVRHGLDFVPQNFIVIGKDSAFHVYDGQQSSTKTYIYLRASAAGSARVFLF